MATFVEKDDPFTGGLFLGFRADGSCLIKGMGEISCSDAEKISKALVLMAHDIRDAARKSQGMFLLH